jgi:hypothetical protein
MPLMDRGASRHFHNFRHTIQELLHIELFCQKIFNKIKTKNYREIRARSWYCWKALNDWDFLKVIS